MFRFTVRLGPQRISSHAKRNLANSVTKRCYAIRAPPPPPPKQTNSPSIPAMLAVASMGFAAYWQLVKSREGKTMPRKKDYTTVEEEEALRKKRLAEVQAKRGKPLKPIPAFSPAEVTVVFLVGGPGAGKRTQCEALAKKHGYVHLSVGDLLRAEIDKGEESEFKDVVTEYILQEGLTVPLEATIPILEKAIKAALDEGKPARFLIDGFPRKLEQAIKFEEVIVPARFVVYLECPENVMLQRLRSQTEKGEEATNAADQKVMERFNRRFNIYKGSAEPVLEKFATENKLKKVSCDQPVDKIYAQITGFLDESLSEKKSE